jgi:predicted PurR-regulated permease PerM
MKLTVYAKSVLQLAVIVAFCYLIYSVRFIIVYFIIAAIISILIKPLTDQFSKIKIKKHQFPRALGAAITIISLFGVIALANYLVLPSFAQEIKVLSKINFHEVFLGMEDEYSHFKDFLSSVNIDFGTEENDIKQSVLGFLNINTLTSTFGGILGGLGNLAVATFSILFMLFFFLKEEKLSQSIFTSFVPDRFLDRWLSMMPKMKQTLARYLKGLIVQMLGVFTLVFLGLKFFVGLESALVIALFAALVNLIPYIGPIFGMAFGVIIGVGQAYALGLDAHLGAVALKIVGVFAVTQLTDNVVFQPVIFSNSINAHPLEIFIVIAIAGTLAGATGMLIAVPTYSIFRIFAKEFLQHFKIIRSLTFNL